MESLGEGLEVGLESSDFALGLAHNRGVRVHHLSNLSLVLGLNDTEQSGLGGLLLVFVKTATFLKLL